MKTYKIKQLPVVIKDINDDEVDDYLLISLNQSRNKTDIQIAREYEIIGRKYKIRRGKGNEIRNAEGKVERIKLLENLSSVSEPTIKRIIMSKKLLMELDNLDEEKLAQVESLLKDKNIPYEIK
jgi:hypothetical protein